LGDPPEIPPAVPTIRPMSVVPSKYAELRPLLCELSKFAVTTVKTTPEARTFPWSLPARPAPVVMISPGNLVALVASQ